MWRGRRPRYLVLVVVRHVNLVLVVQPVRRVQRERLFGGVTPGHANSFAVNQRTVLLASLPAELLIFP